MPRVVCLLTSLSMATLEVLLAVSSAQHSFQCCCLLCTECSVISAELTTIFSRKIFISWVTTNIHRMTVFSQSIALTQLGASKSLAYRSCRGGSCVNPQTWLFITAELQWGVPVLCIQKPQSRKSMQLILGTAARLHWAEDGRTLLCCFAPPEVLHLLSKLMMSSEFLVGKRQISKEKWYEMCQDNKDTWGFLSNSQFSCVLSILKRCPVADGSTWITHGPLQPKVWQYSAFFFSLKLSFQHCRLSISSEHEFLTVHWEKHENISQLYSKSSEHWRRVIKLVLNKAVFHLEKRNWLLSLALGLSAFFQLLRAIRKRLLVLEEERNHWLLRRGEKSVDEPRRHFVLNGFTDCSACRDLGAAGLCLNSCWGTATLKIDFGFSC